MKRTCNYNPDVFAGLKNALQQAPFHDDIACRALKEYEDAAQKRDEWMYEQITTKKGQVINGRRRDTLPLDNVPMSFFASKYNTSIEEMKRHWRCIEKTPNN